MCIRDSSSSSETALERNKSHSRECEAKINEIEESVVQHTSNLEHTHNNIDKIAGNGGAPDKEITADQMCIRDRCNRGQRVDAFWT